MLNVTCPECHARLSLAPQRITLVRTDTTHRYEFRCPGCKTWCSRQAGKQAVATLTAAGVPERVPVPAPLCGGEPPTGPALTEDEVIDFGRALEAADSPLAELG